MLRICVECVLRTCCKSSQRLIIAAIVASNSEQQQRQLGETFAWSKRDHCAQTCTSYAYAQCLWLWISHYSFTLKNSKPMTKFLSILVVIAFKQKFTSAFNVSLLLRRQYRRLKVARLLFSIINDDLCVISFWTLIQFERCLENRAGIMFELEVEIFSQQIFLENRIHSL